MQCLLFLATIRYALVTAVVFNGISGYLNNKRSRPLFTFMKKQGNPSFPGSRRGADPSSLKLTQLCSLVVLNYKRVL